MGFFDPPFVNVRKRLPQHALPTFTSIETFAKGELEGIDTRQLTHALGYILSLWTCNASMRGQFQLSQFDFRYAENVGRDAFGRLTPQSQERANDVVGKLAEEGLLARPSEPGNSN